MITKRCEGCKRKFYMKVRHYKLFCTPECRQKHRNYFKVWLAEHGGPTYQRDWMRRDRVLRRLAATLQAQRSETWIEVPWFG